MGRAVPPVWALAPWDPRLLASLCTPTPSPVSGSLLQCCTPGWGRRAAAPRCLSSPREQQFLTVLSEQRSVGPHGGTAAPQIRLVEAKALGVSDAALLGGIPAPRHFARWAAEILKTELSKQRARFLGNGRRWERCFLAPAPRAEWILAVCWQMGRRTLGRGGGVTPSPGMGQNGGCGRLGGAVGSFQWGVLGGGNSVGNGEGREGCFVGSPRGPFGQSLGPAVGQELLGLLPTHAAVRCVQKWGGGCCGDPWNSCHCGTTLSQSLHQPVGLWGRLGC